MAHHELIAPLIEELKRDQKKAFLALVEHYQGRIYTFASRMCRDIEDARDVLQETFLAAYRALKDFRGEGKLSTWLFRIASNACRKIRRKGKFEPERELSLEEFLPLAEGTRKPEIPDWSQNPEALLLKEELQKTLEEGIAQLPEPYRIVLLLRDLEGFSAEEVAEILGLSVPAVKSRLHRARLFLRERLSEYFSGRS